MSGSLGSSDIEDVVSSVRRLVSVDGRPRPVTRDLRSDRLVLTPALRIVPESAIEVPALPEEDPEDILAIPVEEAALDDVAGDALPETLAEAAPALHLVEDDWEEEIWSDTDLPLAELALGTEEAELVASVDEDLPPPAAKAAPQPTEADADAPWAQAEAGWADARPDLVVPFDAARSRVAPSPVEDERPRSEAVELTDPDGNPLTILDEVALQEIVRQMIREELQGDLGERITRNVRKLVRAEINRALTARALD